MKDWKHTLLMPETEFSMKASLTEKEPIFRQKWLDLDIYHRVLVRNLDLKIGRYILHDGPPYANGSLHVGHALNKTLKDIIVRRKSMEGLYSPFVLGWDTHGLPIENKMLEELKMSKDDLDPLVLRKEAEKYARNQIEIQKSQFEKLQLFTDFNDKYITLDREYEAKQLKLFKKMVMDGLIYKGLKPIYWSPSSQTALAEAEVEYEDVRSPQIIVSLKIVEGNKDIDPGINLLIMTTTPWTLPANSGVAIGENYNYALVQAKSEIYILAEDLISSVQELSGWEEYSILKIVSGKQLVGLKYLSPLNKLICPVVVGHHVTTDVGTGLVHMAPLFGEDDYIIGKNNNLEMIMHVNGTGHITPDGGKYAGLFYQDANKIIGEDLSDSHSLLSLKFIKHSYPHDWRTHKPVIFRGVPQWFVNIKPIKEKILKELDLVTSTPDWGVEKLKKMISNREEWTISRQRTWGVPIIIFYDQDKNPVFNEEIFDYVIALVEQEGTNIWWEKETDDLLPSQFRGLNWTREMDIMDVWFDSGSSSIAVLPNGEEAPFDLYLEGSDQYRGWFNSSLINSVAWRRKSPFKNLLSHGFTLDGKHQKMSKSKGNTIDPLEIINKEGAEILRLWAANSEFTSDISISNDILKQNVEIYRRIRNTFKFMLGNLNDFTLENNSVTLEGIHLMIQNNLISYHEKVTKSYESFKFLEIVKETNKFFVDLSGWYFDYAKDILYCNDSNSLERRMIQTNIYNICFTTLISLAPILPTSMEEVYSFFPKKDKQDSVFLELAHFDLKFEELSFDAKEFNNQKDLANKTLEEARKSLLIKRNNEAILVLNLPKENAFFPEKDYAKYFMVSEVGFGDNWEVKTYNSVKCERCWNHFRSEDIKDGICPRCASVVNKNKS